MQNELQFLRDMGTGAYQVGRTFLQDMIASPVAGLTGLATLPFEGAAKSAKRVEALRDKLGYRPPAGSIGERGLGQIEKGIESAKAAALRAPGARSAVEGWEGFTGASPLAAALLVGSLEAGMPGKRGMRLNPKQAELPGMERTPVERFHQAQADLEQGARDASFSDDIRDYDYRRGYSGEFPYRSSVRNEAVLDNRSTPSTSGDSIARFMIPLSDEKDMIRTGGAPTINRARENAQRVEELAEIRDREQSVLEGKKVDAAEQRMQGKREALRGAWRDPSTNLQDLLAQKEAYVDALARQPVRNLRGEAVQFDPLQNTFRRPVGDESAFMSSDDLRIRRERMRPARAKLEALRSAVNEVEAPPPPVPKPDWATDLTVPPTQRPDMRDFSDDPRLRLINRPAGEEAWYKSPGLGNDAGMRNVADFLRGVEGRPEFFEYGIPPDTSNLNSILRHYSQYLRPDPETGERPTMRGHIEETYGNNDQPEYIKVEKPKELSQGDYIRDRYGDYKIRSHEAGDMVMYDDAGNIKKVEKYDEEGNPYKVPRVAEGGEPKRDEYGDYVYKEAEGGEPKRDERGRQVYKTVEKPNPDYDEYANSGYEGRIFVGGDEITMSPGSETPIEVYAMNAGKHGAPMYQALYSWAKNNDIPIGTNGLTYDNQLRVLSNVLSSTARHGGKAIRDLSETRSGLQPRARGFDTGPNIWRAEAGEARQRVQERGGNPDRLGFDGQSFTIDGRPATDKEIRAQINDLSPGIKGKVTAPSGETFGGSSVGEKTLKRMALINWLRQAEPEQVENLSKNWPKNLGPIFTGMAGAAVGLPMLMQQQPSEETQ